MLKAIRKMFSYPFAPAQGKTDTSKLAAKEIESVASNLRGRALELLQKEALTADECATKLGESVLAVRPRVTELNKQGKIKNTTERRLNQTGKKAIVWAGYDNSH